MALAANLSSDFHRRLIRSWEWSREKQKPFLEFGMMVLKQLVGKHYGGGNAAEREVPQGYIRLMQTTLSRYLTSRSPQALVETFDPRARAIVRQGQLWANERFRVSGLEKVLQRWSADAITYNMGVIKVCERAVGNDYDEPYVDTVDRSRFCFDFAATHWTQAGWAAHQYCVVKDDLLNAEGVDEDEVRKLAPYMPMGNDRTRTESLSHDQGMLPDRLYDYIECWEFYLPREGLLVSYPLVGTTLNPKPVRIVPYNGLAGLENPLGPFQVLIFDEVPGNLMGNPPVSAIYDMHMAANLIARKLLRQGQNQKTINLVVQAMAKEAEKMRGLKDGDWMPTANPEAFGSIRTDGPDAATWGFGKYLENTIKAHGGNLDVLAGIGVAAPTLGQEEMLGANSSKMVQFMASEMNSATAKLMRAMIYYSWESNRVLEHEEPIEGLNMSIPGDILPEERRGTFEKMHITVHPHSMSPLTPQMRLAQMTQLFQEMLQVAPFLVQSGYVPNFIAYFKKKAEYLQMPFIDELLAFNPVSQEQAAAGNQLMSSDYIRAPQRPGVGNYTRTSVSGQADQDQEISSLMKSGNASSNGQAA